VKRGADDHVAASALRAPILESLRELGGAAQSEDVLDRVATKVVLQPNDTRGTKNRPDIPRWKNSAAWVRYELTKNGYVALDTTKRGRWKLTAKGEDLLDAMTGQA
jgi:restriction endonuclease Mrr